jgi:hypothetical protein
MTTDITQTAGENQNEYKYYNIEIMSVLDEFSWYETTKPNFEST